MAPASPFLVGFQFLLYTGVFTSTGRLYFSNTEQPSSSQTCLTNPLPFRGGVAILLDARGFDFLSFLPWRHKALPRQGVLSVGQGGEKRRYKSSLALDNFFLQHCAIFFLEVTIFI